MKISEEPIAATRGGNKPSVATAPNRNAKVEGPAGCSEVTEGDSDLGCETAAKQ